MKKHIRNLDVGAQLLVRGLVRAEERGPVRLESQSATAFCGQSQMPSFVSFVHTWRQYLCQIISFCRIESRQQLRLCNRLHQMSRRLARWLLTAQDRVDSATLEITLDFLATDRPSVTLAARRIQAKKAIRYRRASIDIVNRKRLESLTCQCYRAVQQLNGRLGLDWWESPGKQTAVLRTRRLHPWSARSGNVFERCRHRDRESPSGNDCRAILRAPTPTGR
jgi:hypothetical protein